MLCVAGGKRSRKAVPSAFSGKNDKSEVKFRQANTCILRLLNKIFSIIIIKDGILVPR
jgi:hypothetical protein